MSPEKVTMTVRQVTPQVSVIAIEGQVTAAAEQTLMEAYAQASAGETRVIILDFGQLEYMNSSGIGLVVTVLIRANRQGQSLVTVRLNQHYRHIFELTKLNEAIAIYETEADALAAINPSV